jgi:uncharacterized BrkB/YihY/UPF0761 family membrane protein
MNEYKCPNCPAIILYEDNFRSRRYCGFLGCDMKNLICSGICSLCSLSLLVIIIIYAIIYNSETIEKARFDDIFYAAVLCICGILLGLILLGIFLCLFVHRAMFYKQIEKPIVLISPETEGRMNRK